MSSAASLLKLGLGSDAVITTRFLKCYLAHNHLSPNSLAQARRLFDQVPHKDTVLWSSIICAYSRSRLPAQALRLLCRFHRHFEHGPWPNEYTYASAARAAGSYADLHVAETVHGQAVVRGLISSTVVGTSVLDMYAKCWDLESARRVFDGMLDKNVVTWNSMIAANMTGGSAVIALELFYQMKCMRFTEVDEFTFSAVLMACAVIGDLRSGVQIHSFFLQMGYGNDLAVLNAAGNMYFRSGEVEFAERLLKVRENDLSSKLIMIKGYSFNGKYESVIRTIAGGHFLQATSKDFTVLVPVLSACAKLSLLRIGQQVHGLIITLGSDQNHDITNSCLIDMYYSCSCISEANLVFYELMEKDVTHWNAMVVGSLRNGLIENARHFFEVMPKRNVISWTAMISGYTSHGLAEEALKLLPNSFEESLTNDEKCSVVTVALNACSCLASVDAGKQLHSQALKISSDTNDKNNMMLKTALIDMYSKSGGLSYAQKLFDRICIKNVVVWTSMISAYGSYGLAFEALQIFEQMLASDVKPNEVTFIAVLSACSHCGLFEEGIHYFYMIRELYGIVPRGDHWACVVDMFARAGKLEEAWHFVLEVTDFDTSRNKGCEINAKDYGAILGALLNGCALHGNVEMGSKVASKMLKSNLQISDTYVALSNGYASAKMWNEVYKIRHDWKKCASQAFAGCSRVQSMISG